MQTLFSVIKKTTIDQVFETSRVEEVIGDFITLKKSGANYKGLSPFTKEKTPSFMVSPVKQIWKDFSSGKGGNAVAFLMEHEHFSYPEAIRYLAKKYSIEIEESVQSDLEKKLYSEKESMYLVVDYACSFFQNSLLNSDQGKIIGLTYFKERGFTKTTISFFRLGYSLDSPDSLLNDAQKKGYNIDFLIKTGLVFAKENSTKTFDRFRSRLIFPIRTMSGRIQGFGGRILSDSKHSAKYINSPESDIYNKSKTLYGLFESKKSIAKEDCCYIVEGYTDVIQMYQSGITNVVSSSGTALTSDQIRLIKRLTSNIVLLFDSDPAGIRAAIRGVDMILDQGINVRICTFPEGEDPDSFAKKNSTEVINQFLKDNTKDFIQFKAKLLYDDSINDPIKKTLIVRDIIQSISRIPDIIKQEFYLKSCSEIMGVSENVIFSAFAQINSKIKRNNNRLRARDLSKTPIKRSELKKIDSKYILEKQIISILLQYGHLEAEYEEMVIKSNEKGELIESFENIKSKVFEKIFLDLQQDEVELADPIFRKLFNKLITAYQIKSDSAINNLVFSESENLSHVVADLTMETEKYFLHSWDSKNIFVKNKTQDLGQLVSETILTLRKNLINDKINILKGELKNKNNKDLLEDIINYNQLKKTVSKKLNRVL